MTAETNELEKTRTFQYDAVGNLTRKMDRLGRITDYVYDNLYRLTAEKWRDEEEAVIRTLSFSYDAAGRLTEASEPAAAYGYQYDGLGRVIYQSQSFADFSPLIEYTSAFDSVGNRISLLAVISGTADFQNTYQYDGLSRLTSLVQAGASGGHAVAEKRVDFGYNAASQFAQLTRYADVGDGDFVALGGQHALRL